MATQEQPERRPTGGGMSPTVSPARQEEGRSIKHLRDTYPGGVKSFVRTVCFARRGTLPTPSSETPSKQVVDAEINHGRWIVKCPFCAGAEAADRDDRRFYCCSCGNRDAGGQWLRVKWPQNYRMLETELLKRSKEKHQNWKPGQTVKDLANENTRNGVVR